MPVFFHIKGMYEFLVDTYTHILKYLIGYLENVECPSDQRGESA